MENFDAGVSRRMVNLWLDMAEMMLSCGAEIHRIEDTLDRIGKASGARRMEIFVITSSIVVTAEGDEWQYTVTRRMRGLGGTDFAMLEDLNALARRFCRAPLSESELENELARIDGNRPKDLKTLTGDMLAAFAFTLFFGGSIWDALLSGIFGLAVCLMLKAFSRVNINRFGTYFLSSVSTGVVICLISKFIPVLKPDKIIVGVIMLTIPGIATTNSIRDMLTGDTLSGILRLIQSMLEAFVLAGSFMFAMWLTKSGVTYNGAPDGIYQLLPAIGGTLGFAMMFNCRLKYLIISIPGGAVCWGVYLMCEFCLGLGVFPCSLIAALSVSLLSEISARLFKAPATLFLIPFVVPLIPGSSLFYSFSSMLGQTSSVFGMNTIQAVLGIAIGTGVIATVFSLRRKA